MPMRDHRSCERQKRVNSACENGRTRKKKRMTTWSEITCFLLGKASSEVDEKGRGEAKGGAAKGERRRRTGRPRRRRRACHDGGANGVFRVRIGVDLADMALWRTPRSSPATATSSCGTVRD